VIEMIPPNDDFANPIMLTGSSLLTTGTTVGASAEIGESVFGWTQYQSIWWAWTAPTNGRVVFDSGGAGFFDPFLAVYSGDSLTNLVLLGWKPYSWQFDYFLERLVPIDVHAGVTYHITMAGFFGRADEVHLRLTFQPAPFNDNFADRTIIPSDFSIV